MKFSRTNRRKCEKIKSGKFWTKLRKFGKNRKNFGKNREKFQQLTVMGNCVFCTTWRPVSIVVASRQCFQPKWDCWSRLETWKRNVTQRRRTLLGNTVIATVLLRSANLCSAVVAKRWLSRCSQFVIACSFSNKNPKNNRFSEILKLLQTSLKQLLQFQ